MARGHYSASDVTPVLQCCSSTNCGNSPAGHSGSSQCLSDCHPQSSLCWTILPHKGPPHPNQYQTLWATLNSDTASMDPFHEHAKLSSPFDQPIYDLSPLVGIISKFAMQSQALVNSTNSGDKLSPLFRCVSIANTCPGQWVGQPVSWFIGQSNFQISMVCVSGLDYYRATVDHGMSYIFSKIKSTAFRF